MLTVKECKALARQLLVRHYTLPVGSYLLAWLISSVLSMISFACLGFAICHARIPLPIDILGLGESSFSVTLIIMGVMAFSAVAVISVFMYFILEIGREKLFIRMCRGQAYGIDDYFYGFTPGSHPFSYIFAAIILALIISVFGFFYSAATFLTGFIPTSGLIRACVNGIFYALFTLAVVYIDMSFLFVKIILADRPGTGTGEAFMRSFEMMKGIRLKGFWMTYISFVFWRMAAAICPLASLWIMPYIECTKVIFYMNAEGSVWQIPGSERVPGAPEPVKNTEAEAVSEQTPEPVKETVPDELQEATQETETPTQTDKAETAGE